MPCSQHPMAPRWRRGLRHGDRGAPSLPSTSGPQPPPEAFAAIGGGMSGERRRLTPLHLHVSMGVRMTSTTQYTTFHVLPLPAGVILHTMVVTIELGRATRRERVGQTV